MTYPRMAFCLLCVLPLCRVCSRGLFPQEGGGREEMRGFRQETPSQAAIELKVYGIEVGFVGLRSARLAGVDPGAGMDGLHGRSVCHFRFRCRGLGRPPTALSLLRKGRGSLRRGSVIARRRRSP